MTDLRIMSGSENAGSFTAVRQQSLSVVGPPVGWRKPKSGRVGWRPGVGSERRLWETHYLLPTSTIVEEFVNPFRSSPGRRTGGSAGDPAWAQSPHDVPALPRTFSERCRRPRQAVRGSSADYTGRDAVDDSRKSSCPAGRAAPLTGHPKIGPILARTHAVGGLEVGYSTGSTRMPIPVPCQPRKRTGASGRTRQRSAYVRS